jgi:hypothetical protein
MCTFCKGQPGASKSSGGRRAEARGQGLERALSYPLVNHTCEIVKAGQDCKVMFADLGNVVDDVRRGRFGTSGGGRGEGRDDGGMERV